MKCLSLFIFSLSLIFFSCSKKDSHTADTGCHDCHIAQDNGNGGEIEFEIGEFCGDNLADVEANGYHAYDTLYSAAGDTLLPGHYDEVHCEEHSH